MWSLWKEVLTILLEAALFVFVLLGLIWLVRQQLRRRAYDATPCHCGKCGRKIRFNEAVGLYGVTKANRPTLSPNVYIHDNQYVCCGKCLEMPCDYAAIWRGRIIKGSYRRIMKRAGYSVHTA